MPMATFPRFDPQARHRARHAPRLGARRLLAAALLGALVLPGASSPAAAATLLDVDFDGGSDGFAYVDDAFLGTSQPAYATGQWSATAGYGSSGGLVVTLGGVDGASVTGMSGGWGITLNLPAAVSGASLSYRYHLQQTATYEFNEHSRVLASLDGALLGRGLKDYVDHVGGDGSSTQGSSNTYLPTTDWQEHEVYLGNLSAGSHVLRLGGYNNAKNASDESTTVVLDDVRLIDGQAAPETPFAETLSGLVDLERYKDNIESLADFGDRCRMSSCPGSPPNSYLDAQDWVAEQLEDMGYTPQYHDTIYVGSSITNLYATKVGTERPEEMYIVSAHLDGRGGGGAADDDGSGVSVVLEAARVLGLPDVDTETSVRFIFWDREEAGLVGSTAYVAERQGLQGAQSPPGSGLYPEPTWLGILQHDMVLYDHGAGTPSPNQSAFADMDVEWRAGTAEETASRALALTWHNRGAVYAQDYPSTAYNHSTNTDDTPFHPHTASISVRENRRSLTSGGNAEWINPNYHQTSDVYASYSEDDFELGADIARTTLGTVAELAGAYLVGHPTAHDQTVLTAKGVPVPVVLSATDPDGEAMTFAVASQPAHGTLSGAAPSLVYTPDPGYAGPDAFTFTASDGLATSDPATVSIVVAAARHYLPFADNFDGDLGWVPDFFGTDTASGGDWERGDPGPTYEFGPKQLGVAASELLDLVTGARSGASADANDVDGGTTSVLSPALVLPADHHVELSLAFYLAHARNASADDYLRVRVVGGDGQTDVTILEERGAPDNDDGAWKIARAPLDAFAGQTVTLRIDAADLGRPSLIEAAVDDVVVKAVEIDPTLIDATFDAGAEGFTYLDDAFRGTSQPSYAGGAYGADGGYEGGGLTVALGGIDNEIVEGISGGWSAGFTLPSAGTVWLSFWYRLTQTPDYDAGEYSEALVAVDGVLIGEGDADYIARVHGNGNGGIPEGTGWRTFAASVGPLSAGSHTLVIGGHNNRKSWDNESTAVQIDEVLVYVEE